jgi:hypothetical protein
VGFAGRVVVGEDDDAADSSLDELLRILVPPLARAAGIGRGGDAGVERAERVGVLLSFGDEDGALACRAPRHRLPEFREPVQDAGGALKIPDPAPAPIGAALPEVFLGHVVADDLVEELPPLVSIGIRRDWHAPPSPLSGRGEEKVRHAAVELLGHRVGDVLGHAARMTLEDDALIAIAEAQAGPGVLTSMSRAIGTAPIEPLAVAAGPCADPLGDLSGGDHDEGQATARVAVAQADALLAVVMGGAVRSESRGVRRPPVEMPGATRLNSAP